MERVRRWVNALEDYTLGTLIVVWQTSRKRRSHAMSQLGDGVRARH